MCVNDKPDLALRKRENRV